MSGRVLNFMGTVRTIDYPPTGQDDWLLVSNAATGLDATKRADAHGVFITVENESTRYSVDGNGASGDDRSCADGGQQGHQINDGGTILMIDPTGAAFDNFSIVNCSSAAAATIHITYY